MRQRCHAADAEAGASFDELGVGPSKSTDPRGHLLLVDTAVARGDDQHRGIVVAAPKNNALGDLANLDNVMIYRTGPDGKLTSSMYDLDRVRSGEIPDPVVLPEDVIVVQRKPVRVLLRDSAVSDFINLLNPFNYMK